MITDSYDGVLYSLKNKVYDLVKKGKNRILVTGVKKGKCIIIIIFNTYVMLIKLVVKIYISNNMNK